jgi:hypothetical protein
MEFSPAPHALLTVAGTGARIHSAAALEHYDDPGYSAFLCTNPPHSDQPDAIDIEVTSTSCPACDAPFIFECDDAWSMQLEPDGYRVSFRRVDTREIHTVLRSDRGTTKVTVHTDQGQDDGAPSEVIMNPVHYPLDQVMFINHFALRGGVICHAAAAVVDGMALVFPGVSGAGKSTLSRQFVRAGLGDVLLSDDRVVLRRTSPGEGKPETINAWGTPWHGDADIAQNKSAPLAAVLFLVQSDVDKVVPIAPGKAMRRLMPIVSCPWYDPERLPPVLDTCGRVVETVPCYELHFTRDGDVVGLLTGMNWA